jgi:hypothetical protein
VICSPLLAALMLEEIDGTVIRWGQVHHRTSFRVQARNSFFSPSTVLASAIDRDEDGLDSQSCLLHWPPANGNLKPSTCSRSSCLPKQVAHMQTRGHSHSSTTRMSAATLHSTWRSGKEQWGAGERATVSLSYPEVRVGDGNGIAFVT